MKKRYLASTAALALAMALTACGGAGSSAEAANTPEPTPTYVNTPENCSHSYHLQDDSHESTDTESGLRHYLCELCGNEYSYETDPLVYTTNPKTGEPVTQAGAYNPLLPTWEHIPDGEPQVYWSKEDNEWRVFLYGSHDDEGVSFCGLNYVLWSAPVYDLSDWRCDGTILDISEQNTYGGFSLFAPDCAYDVTTDTYYMVANQMNSAAVLRAGPTPAGPFVEDAGLWTRSTKACYDPTIYIEDGTIYIAGSCMKQTYTKEESMADVAALVAADGYASGMSHIGVIYQLKEDLSDGDGIEAISWMPNDERDFLPVYEGPSLVGWVDELGAYVYLYVSNDHGEDGTSYTCSLAYMYTDDLMNGTWHYGENGIEEIYPELDYTVSGNHGNTVADVSGRYFIDPATGKMTFRDFATYTYSNDHGGLAKVNGEWYIFGHRHSNAHTSSRQTIAEKINLYAENGAPVIEPMEFTSSGVAGSMDAYTAVDAWRACYLIEATDHPAPSTERANPHSDCAANTPYIVSTRDEEATHATYVTNLANGNVVGFKYLDFGSDETALTLEMLVSQGENAVNGSVEVWIDAPEAAQGGTLLGSMEITAATIAAAEQTETASDGTVWSWLTGEMDTPASGTHSVYFVFQAPGSGYVCRMDAFRFGKAA